MKATLAFLLLSVCLLRRDSDAFVSTVRRLQSSRPLAPWSELARWSRLLLQRQHWRAHLQLTAAAADGAEEDGTLSRDTLINKLAAARDKQELMYALASFVNNGAPTGPWGTDDVARVAGILDGVAFETPDNLRQRMTRVLEKIDPQRLVARGEAKVAAAGAAGAAGAAREAAPGSAAPVPAAAKPRAVNGTAAARARKGKGPRNTGATGGVYGPRKKESELLDEIAEAVAAGNLQTFARSTKVRTWPTMAPILPLSTP